MGSNGTAEERLARPRPRATVLGAAWRENLRWPDRRIGKDPAHLEQAVAFIRRHRPRTVAVPYWSDRHPDHVAASAVLTEAVFNAGLRRYPAKASAWKADWICYYFINDSAAPSFVVDVSDALRAEARALDCHATSFSAGTAAAGTRLNTPLFRQLIESRDAQFGALAGVSGPRASSCGSRFVPAGACSLEDSDADMNIGIVCYASVGGSGIIATELGKMLAARGHRRPHPQQRHAGPARRLPARAVVSSRRDAELSAVPRAAVPAVARQQDRAGRRATSGSTSCTRTTRFRTRPPRTWRGRFWRRRAGRVPRVITTLHGTDITLLGSDRSYSETVAFCIEQSDGVTAVSESLKAGHVPRARRHARIRVIPNFLDCSVAPPARRRRASRAAGAATARRSLIHVSNFRPVKRVTAVVEVFARVQRAKCRRRLLMVGDGPELADASRLARALGVADDVEFLGEQDQVVPLLSAADVFLLPSAQESFGLAALEAMACEVPVVASRVGGLPEVIEDGVNGFLHAPDDLDGMAASTLGCSPTTTLHRQCGGGRASSPPKAVLRPKIVPAVRGLLRGGPRPQRIKSSEGSLCGSS